MGASAAPRENWVVTTMNRRFKLVSLAAGSALMTVALVAAASVLLHMEFALIIPEFAMTHHGAQLYCFLFLSLLAWQLPVEGTRVLLRSIRERLRDREMGRDRVSGEEP